MARGRKTGGRKKGTPNHSTAAVRAVIEQFARQNAPQLQSLFERLAEEDPGKAFDLYLRAIEYHIPKLGRQELVGDSGGPVEFVIRDLGKES